MTFPLEKQSDIGFLYSILGRINSQEDNAIILQDSSIIHTGDKVRINVGYQKNSHMYVIYKGSEGEFDLLYSDNIKMQRNLADLPDTIYTTVLPWSLFSDPIGYETFFLINSDKFQENLTNLFTRYTKVNKKGQKKIAKQIQNAIDNLDPDGKNDLFSIGSRLDKPIVGGVTFRGDDKEELKDLSLTHHCIGNAKIAFKRIILNHK